MARTWLSIRVDLVEGGDELAELVERALLDHQQHEVRDHDVAIVTHRPRTATVTTATEVRALVLTAREFERLVRDVPSIAVKVLKAVGERLPAEH